MLIGRPEVIAARVERFGLRIAAGKDFDLVNINSDPRYKACWQLYYQLMGRQGISPEDAKEAVLRKPSLIGTLLLKTGACDALLCGTVGKYQAHLKHVADVIGLRPEAPVFAAMNALILPNRTLFICDTYVNRDPSVEQLVGIAQLAAEGVRNFGLVPKMALLSHSNFGCDDSDSARKMRRVRERLVEHTPQPLDQPNFLAVLMSGAALIPTPPLVTAPIVAPVKEATAEYGQFMTTFLDCKSCHGENLSGGDSPISPQGPSLRVVKGWTQEQFINTLRTGVDPNGDTLKPPMPWRSTSRLDDVELAALYQYLISLK